MRTRMRLAVTSFLLLCPLAARAGFNATITSPTAQVYLNNQFYPKAVSGGGMQVLVSAGGDSFYRANWLHNVDDNLSGGGQTWHYGSSGTYQDSFSAPTNTSGVYVVYVARYWSADYYGQTLTSVDRSYAVESE